MSRPVRQWKAGMPAPPQGFSIQSAKEICFHQSTLEHGVRISLRRESGKFVALLTRAGYQTMREELDTEVMGRKRFERFVEAHYDS